MKFEPIVTVILPVYNGSTHLENAINSIQNQSLKSWELLVINDGSVDNSLAVAHKLAANDKRIRVINFKHHRGLVYCLNKGIQLSIAPYIARQDADDYSQPKRLELESKFLDRHPDVGLVCSLFDVLADTGEYIKTSALPLNDFEIKLSMLFYNPLTHGAVMLKKSLLTQHKLSYSVADAHCEDFGLWVKLAKFTKFKILPQSLYQWRISKGGITAHHLKAMQRKRRSLAEQMVKDIDKDKLLSLTPMYKKQKIIDKQTEKIIDYPWMYQKLLISCAKVEAARHNVLSSLQLFITAVWINPNAILTHISVPYQFRHASTLPLTELVNKSTYF